MPEQKVESDTMLGLPTLTQPLEKIETLDGLRGVAVLLVVWAHLPVLNFFPELKYYANTYGVGYLGVDIFFVLSGFLITRILLREKQEGVFSFRNFYIKRALRIFPIYLITILFVGLLIHWDRMIWVALYLSNFYFAFDLTNHPMRHTWSLAVEEHFYLIWPFILAFLTIRSSRFVIGIVLPLLAILSAVITANLLDSQLTFDLIYRGTNYRMLSLSLGAFMAYYEGYIKKIHTVIWVTLLIFIRIFFTWANDHEELRVSGILVSHLTLTLIYFALASTLILLVVIRLNYMSSFIGKLKFIFINPVLRYIGKVSYGIYLYHFPILYILGLKTDDTIDLHTLAVLVILFFGIPSLSYYIIERPFLRLKTRLAPVPAHGRGGRG